MTTELQNMENKKVGDILPKNQALLVCNGSMPKRRMDNAEQDALQRFHSKSSRRLPRESCTSVSDTTLHLLLSIKTAFKLS
jgi:hypothetical protein